VAAATVSTGSVALAKETVADHGDAAPPAGRQHHEPIVADDEFWTTVTLMLSSTPVMVPPTRNGYETMAP